MPRRSSASTTSISARGSPTDFNGVEGKDYGLAAITTAGENLVLCSGIMAGPKAIYARGGPGAKMGALHLKAVLIQGRSADLATARPHKLRNRDIAVKLLDTSVVKNALKKRGTPFLYKPSRCSARWARRTIRKRPGPISSTPRTSIRTARAWRAVSPAR